MSDSKKVFEATAELGKTEKDGLVKKLTFTPPILNKYGEIVKICRAAPTQGQNDFFTS